MTHRNSFFMIAYHITHPLHPRVIHSPSSSHHFTTLWKRITFCSGRYVFHFMFLTLLFCHFIFPTLRLLPPDLLRRTNERTHNPKRVAITTWQIWYRTNKMRIERNKQTKSRERTPATTTKFHTMNLSFVWPKRNQCPGSMAPGAEHSLVCPFSFRKDFSHPLSNNALTHLVTSKTLIVSCCIRALSRRSGVKSSNIKVFPNGCFVSSRNKHRYTQWESSFAQFDLYLYRLICDVLYEFSCRTLVLLFVCVSFVWIKQ